LFFVLGYRSFIFLEAFNDLLVSHAANHDTLNGSHKYESFSVRLFAIAVSLDFSERCNGQKRCLG